MIALEQGHIEAAKRIAKKGGNCTPEEKVRLASKYTDFLEQWLQQAMPGLIGAKQLIEKEEENGFVCSSLLNLTTPPRQKGEGK